MGVVIEMRRGWSATELTAVLAAGLKPGRADAGRGVWAHAADDWSIHRHASGTWTVQAPDGRVVLKSLTLNRALMLFVPSPTRAAK